MRMPSEKKSKVQLKPEIYNTDEPETERKLPTTFALASLSESKSTRKTNNTLLTNDHIKNNILLQY